MASLKEKLIQEARKIIRNEDPSHDLDHALRVLTNAEHIARFEGGDLEVIIPAALFHDAVNYPKNHPRAQYAAKESVKVIRKILKTLPNYDKKKIARVEKAIIEHSFSKGVKPKRLDSKIVQDADRLEATGAIAIMRTFCSAGQMKRRFYDDKDPFCEKREPNGQFYAVDLFYNRLLKVRDLMNTKTARKLAKKRTRFLHTFLKQFKEELMIISAQTIK